MSQDDDFNSYVVQQWEQQCKRQKSQVEVFLNKTEYMNGWPDVLHFDPPAPYNKLSVMYFPKIGSLCVSNIVIKEEKRWNALYLTDPISPDTTYDLVIEYGFETARISFNAGTRAQNKSTAHELLNWLKNARKEYSRALLFDIGPVDPRVEWHIRKLQEEQK